MFSVKFIRQKFVTNRSLQKKKRFAEFPFLRDSKSIRYIRRSKVVFIMRGLPGSGKSFLATQITQRYRCSNIVCSADHYFMLYGKYSHEQTKLGEAHKYCQETCKKAMVIEKEHIIIDNSNIQRFEIQTYFSLAKANNYLALIVEPQTSWKFDVQALAANNIHGCSPDYIEGKKSQYIDIQPKYWALFLNEQDSKCIQVLARSHFYECLNLFPVFAKNLSSSCPSMIFIQLQFKIFISIFTTLLQMGLLCMSIITALTQTKFYIAPHASLPLTIVRIRQKN